MNEQHSRRPNENAREVLDEQVADLPGEITRRWRLLTAAERNAEEYRERVEAIQRTVRQGLESVDDAVVSDVPAGEYAYATVEGVTALMRSCPVPFRPWLEAVLRDYAAALDFDSQEFLHLVCDSEEFLKEVGRLGLVRAVLLEIDRRDSDGKECRRGEDRRYMPNEDIVPAVLCHAFEFEEPVESVGYGTYWRVVVIKWLPDYLGENRGELFALLTRALNWPAAEDSYHAALHLAELAPETPGLPARLLDAACDHWVASHDAHYETGETGADQAIAALARLEASRLRPELLAALAAGRCQSPSAGADLYLQWGGDAAALVRRSWDAPVEVGQTLIKTLQALPPDTEGLAARLAARVPDSGSDVCDVLDALAPFGCRSEKVLPALARLLGDRDDRGYNRENGSKLQRTFLTALPEHPDRWTEEDRWVSVLRGKPATAFDWAVYADWLDDRDDPRGEYVRLRHLIACGSAERAEADAIRNRSDAWLIAHGHGWSGVYDLIKKPPTVA